MIPIQGLVKFNHTRLPLQTIFSSFAGYDLPFAKNANGIARGPKIAPITPQNTGLDLRFFAIKWQIKILTMFATNNT